VNEKRPPALKRRILSDALTPAIKAEASTQKLKKLDNVQCIPGFGQSPRTKKSTTEANYFLSIPRAA
jgi:hypothetical protein